MYKKDGKDQSDALKFIERLQKAAKEAQAPPQRVEQIALGFANDLQKSLKLQKVKPETAGIMQSVTLVVVYCWTSGESDRSEREFCSYLQEATRLDLDDCMQAVAQLWRTINLHVVAPRERTKHGLKSQISWPQDFLLHRGSRLPEKHLQWFVDAAKEVKIFRNKSAIATTKIKHKAIDFMHEYSYPKDDDSCHRAYWVFHLDPEQKCKHVNCLEGMTLVPEEEEFLFPPYSAFQMKSITWTLTHWTIEVTVLHDNKSQTDGGPVPNFSPLAPWL